MLGKEEEEEAGQAVEVAALAASEKKGLDTSIEVSVVQKRANDCQIGGNFENLVSE